nr:hypothetical protein [Pseudomonas sp. BIGb0427]
MQTLDSYTPDAESRNNKQGASVKKKYRLYSLHQFQLVFVGLSNESFVNVRTFTRLYFPRLIAVILMTTASFSFATLNVTYTFFHKHPYENEYAVGSVVTAAFLLSFGSYILIRGRVWGVWVIVGILLACFSRRDFNSRENAS